MWKYCICTHIKEYDRKLNILIDDDVYMVRDKNGDYFADIRHATLFDTKEEAGLYARNVLKFKKVSIYVEDLVIKNLFK